MIKKFHWLKNEALIVCVLTGLAILMALEVFQHFAPGAMSQDSFVILSHARSGVYSDSHPPLMSLIWSVVDKVIPGPLGILLMNLGLFYGGLLLIFLRLVQRCGFIAAPLFVIVGLYPPVIALLGVIWIDLTMAAVFVFAIGLFLSVRLDKDWKRRRNAFSAIFVLILISVGLSLRHNGPAAALPLFVFVFYCSTFAQKKTWIRLASSLMLGILVTILCFLGSRQIQSSLVAEKTHLWRVGAVYDIAGTSYYEGKYLFNDSILSGGRVDIETLYSPRSYTPLTLGQQIHALPGQPEKFGNKAELNLADPNLNKLLFDNWVFAIMNYPCSYLKHRYAVFSSLVTRSPWGFWSAIYDRIPPNNMGIPEMYAKDSTYFSFVRRLIGTFIFVPVVYLFLSLVMVGPVLYYSIKKNSEPLALSATLYLSGLLHMVGLFFFAASGDTRYSHWMVLATVLATAVLLSELAMRLHMKFQSASDGDRKLPSCHI